jgi:hypothetical protein
MNKIILVLTLLVTLSVSAFGASVKLDWNPPSVPASTCTPPEINYVNVWRSDSAGFGGQTAPSPAGSASVKIASINLSLTPNVTTYTDNTVVDNHTYYYTISFYKNPPCGGVNGAESLMSNEVQAVVGAPTHINAPVIKLPLAIVP